MPTTPIIVSIPGADAVSGLWSAPPVDPLAVLVLAHGAGAGMRHPSLTGIAEGLERLGIATLRYQFPFMERGSRRPDGPSAAKSVVRAAVEAARALAAGSPLFAGGRSFGGRMTAQAQADAPLEGVGGLVFFAFPLHPAGKPSTVRAQPLFEIRIPMLFLQGSRDALAELSLLEETLASLKGRADLQLIPEADHAFHAPARTGRSDAEVLAGALLGAAEWMRAHTGV